MMRTKRTDMRLLYWLCRLIVLSFQARPPQTNYERYLASAHWQSVRRLALARDGYRCQRCAARRGLQVHHRTYEHMGHEHEHLADLATLCRRHHNQEHGRNR